jgi:cellulose synthase operon protein YhjQ
LAIPEPNPAAPRAVNDQGEATTPDDVATLYSWANLHGAKYRDFSASRAQAREEARLRVEAAQAEERLRQQEEAERIAQEEAQVAARLAAEAAEEARQAEAERLAEISRQAEIEREAVLAAQEAQRQAAQQRSWQPPVEEYQYHPAHDFGSPSLPAGGFHSEQYSGQFTDLTGQVPVSSIPTATGQDAPVSRFLPQADYTSYDRQSPALGNTPISGAPGSDPFAMRAPAFPAVPPSFSGPVASEPQLSARHEIAGPEFARPEFAGSELDRSYEAVQPQKPNRSPWHLPVSREDAPEPRDPRDFVAGPAWLAAEPPQPVSQIAPLPIAFQQPQVPLPPSHFPEQMPQRMDAPKPAQGQIPMYSQPANQYVSAPPVPQSPISQGSLSQSSFGQSPAGSPLSSATSQQGSQQSSHQTSQQITQRNVSDSYASRPIEDTLAGAQDRVASRWFALKGVFDPQPAPIEQAPAQPPAHVPALAVFSLAGGVGKTSLVASLGRALSSRGERVLLVDTAAFGLLPFYFGARDQRPGMLRTFNPPGVSADAPIQVVTIDPDGQPNAGSSLELSQNANQSAAQATHSDWLAEEVVRYTRNSNRLLIDLPTASGSTTRRILRLSPVVLVPVLADMNSVVSVGAIESFFRSSAGGHDSSGKPLLPYYILNQFDYSLPLHLDVREILRDRIGERLLPFALRRSPAVSEALAEGMTVMDYAPSAVIAEDYANLAGWVRSLSAPATQTYRGVRWSER